MVWRALWSQLAVALVLVTRPAQAQEAALQVSEPQNALRFGAGAGVGFGNYRGDELGPWFEGRGVLRWPLSSALYLKGELTLFYSRHLESKELDGGDVNADGDPEQNTDKRTLLSLQPRALLGIGGRRLAFEIGGWFGVARTTLDADICGSSSTVGANYGILAGPAASLGERHQLGVALHAEFFRPPIQLCARISEASNWERIEPHISTLDNVHFATILRIDYMF